MNLDYSRTKDIVYICMLSVVMFVSQIALSFLMNVNIVTLLLTLYVVHYGFRKTYYILVIHVILLGLYYGFAYWLLGYLWIYPVLLFLVLFGFKLFGKNILVFSIIGGLFGLLFGVLFALHDMFFLGVQFLPHYIKGIPVDIVHASSNLIAIILLFKVLDDVLTSRNIVQTTNYQ